MSSRNFVLGLRAALLLSLLVLSGCTLCPGGITVRDNMSQELATHDVMTCESASHGAGTFATNAASKSAQQDRAFGQCMRDLGYLSIPEAVLLNPDAASPSSSAPCATCSKVGALEK